MMKTTIKKGSSLGVLTLMIFSSFAIAQGPDYKMCMGDENIPNLTDEQKAKIEVLKIAHMKEMTSYMTALETLEAQLQQLEIADNADLNKINAKIDEISVVKGNMEKENSKHRQSVRGLLNPEQRTVFDAKCCRGPEHGGCMGHMDGKEHEHSEGYGQNCPKK
jgi:Spy/CpxP family protein refolding chaperone